MDYTSLTGTKATTGSIRSWVNHATVPADEILTEAQAWIYQKLRCREMQTSATGTIAVGSDGFALPSGFIAPLKLTIHDGSEELLYQHEQLFRMPRDENGDLPEGMPTVWSIIDNAAQFDAIADEEFDYTLYYYGAPAALSGSNLTNFLTVRYPTLLRRTCMMFAYEFMKQFDAQDRAELMANRALAEARIADDARRLGQEL